MNQTISQHLSVTFHDAIEKGHKEINHYSKYKLKFINGKEDYNIFIL